MSTFIKTKTKSTVQDSKQTEAKSSAFPMYSVKQAFDDASPVPEDLIAPKILTPGGLLVLGGKPKVGKSDLLLAWVMHMAAGMDFLGMKPPRPLKVVYLTRLRYPYLCEHVQRIYKDYKLTTDEVSLRFIPEVKILNETTVSAVSRTILRHFGDAKVDVIAIDSLNDVFDGKDDGLQEIRAFVNKRLDVLRDSVNPEAAIMLTHTTKHCSKEEAEEDPFQCFGAIRNSATMCINLSKLDGGLEFNTHKASPGKAVVDKSGTQKSVLKPSINKTGV